MKKKLLSGKKLTKALDDAVRDLYHKRYPNPVCFVCGKHPGWWSPKTNPHGCQIGHYISRKITPLRWHLMNIFCQCSGCNSLHQWNLLPFTLRIIEEYGEERITFLNAVYQEYKQGKGMTTLEKRERLSYFQEQLNSKHSV